VPPARARSATLIGLYRQVWYYAKGVRTRYVLALSLLASSQIIKLSVPWLAGEAINTIQTAKENYLLHAGLLIGAIILVNALAWMMHGPGRILERNVGLAVRTAVSDALYAKLLRAPLGWHEGHHSSELAQRVQQSSHALYDFTQTQFVYLQNLINIVGPLVALCLLSVQTGLLALVGFLVIAAAIVRFDHALMRLAVREIEADRRYNAGLLDFTRNIATVMALRLEGAARQLVGQRLSNAFAPLRKSIEMNEAKWCTVDLLTIGLVWGLVAFHAWQSVGGKAGAPSLLLGSIFMVYQYGQQAAAVIGALASNFQSFAGVRANVAGADIIWDAPLRLETHAPIEPQWNSIVITDLTFNHIRSQGNARGEEAIHAVTAFRASLSLRRGARIALIGPSGGGKSTLLRLLGGLYAADSGRIAIDGRLQSHATDLADIATLIPQETEVFEATLSENLTFGASYSQQAIERVTYLSCLDEVLEGLPWGLKTPVSEGGFNLSGGQRQRLALARGLLAAQGCSVLLLDEPTSALDQTTEAQVFERLRSSLADVCIIASVHRLSALRYFDEVVLLAGCRVLDSGTVDELRLRQSLFRTLEEGDESLSEPA
jgi:ABC-type bacteriocin/lantibiotic exporter with double-glycine peptidase domain